MIKYTKPHLAGKNNGRWKGGVNNRCGYIEIYAPWHPNCNSNGYILEHRLVVEQYLGRELSKDEIVHHRDGNRSNNRIDNLELIPNQALHYLSHMQYKFRRDISREKIKDLLIGGYTWRKISNVLGCTRKLIWQRINQGDPWEKLTWKPKL